MNKKNKTFLLYIFIRHVILMFYQRICQQY